MPGSADTSYSAPFGGLPDLCERGAANTLKCPIYRDGALVAPTEAGSTVTVRDPSGNVVVDAAAVTVTGSVATYAWAPAATLAFSEGYLVEWTLVISGAPWTFRNDAAVIRQRLYCPITDADLYRVASQLDPTARDPITRRTTYQPYIDAAWLDLQLLLIARGNRPNLIISPSALREVLIHRTLVYVYTDLGDPQRETWQARAKEHQRKADAAWANLNFATAYASDERTADATRKTPIKPLWVGPVGRGFAR